MRSALVPQVRDSIQSRFYDAVEREKRRVDPDSRLEGLFLGRPCLLAQGHTPLISKTKSCPTTARSRWGIESVLLPDSLLMGTLEQHPDTEFERGRGCCRRNIAPPPQPSTTRGWRTLRPLPPFFSPDSHEGRHPSARAAHSDCFKIPRGRTRGAAPSARHLAIGRGLHDSDLALVHPLDDAVEQRSREIPLACVRQHCE